MTFEQKRALSIQRQARIGITILAVLVVTFIYTVLFSVPREQEPMLLFPPGTKVNLGFGKYQTGGHARP
ncbi:MAG: hypothetical protein KGZ65_04290 [Sphingomonadales bacterium]|nr:hypothetical protein [Sphingomonadaceae bacterium]MBS3930433.1 hypothetical protein [Sphingomonadales bacterium]